MKKVPSIRMPDPKAGVIRSEHPRAVGPNGLVESENWILRDGSMQMRDGIKPVTIPTRTLLGDSWSNVAGNSWSYGLGTEPKDVYMNGAKGTYDATPGAEYEWWWSESVLYVYSATDPYDAYDDPGVEWTSDTNGTAVTSISSFDYQGKDDADDQDVVRDQLLMTTTDEVVCYNNDLSVVRTAVATDVDWSWDGAYGWAEDLADPSGWAEWGLSKKISIDWSNINWGAFSANTIGVGMQLRFGFYTGAGITVALYEIKTASSLWADDVRWVLPGTDSALLSYTVYTQGVPYQISTGGDGGTGTGIYVIFNDTWNSWYDEAAATGDYITGVDMPYYWACYDASEYGLPGRDPIVNLDSTKRPVVRTWDYEQTTHNLIAAEGSYILDIDSDALSSPPDPTVSISGDAGVCPRAKAIGVASQRIIAGNVSYFDSNETMIVNEAYINVDIGSNTAEWDEVVDQFAYFPDAVVYSGTVLTGGHKSWYPADILRLADTPGEVVAIQEMGTQMAAVYKTDAIYTLSAQTGISPFAPSLRASGLQGPVSPRSVVAISDTTHVYLARDGGLYMFSGQSPQSLGDQFRTWVAREIDDPDHQKAILEMELLFDNISDVSGATDCSLDVTVYGGNSNKSLSQLWQETDISLASGQITIHPRVRARYFSVAVEITATVEAVDEDGKDWTQSFGEIEYYGAIVRYKVSGVRQNG